MVVSLQLNFEIKLLTRLLLLLILWWKMKSFMLLCMIVIGISTVQASLLSKQWTRYKSLDGYEAYSDTNETAQSVIHCGTMCQSVSGCRSFFYNNLTTNCYLHNTTFTTSSPMVMSAYTKYYYMHYSSFADCAEASSNGIVESGIYSIDLTDGNKVDVRCDISPDTGGWIVIQRRVNDSDFYKTWDEYKNGFGDLDGNFWLGNEIIWSLTKTGSWKLRVDLTCNGEKGYAEYDYFSVDDEASQYVLSVAGYTGDIGDSFTYNHGMKFSTKERDNDIDITNCAERFHGAWWYSHCHLCNLNGDYGNTDFAVGLNWSTWKGHMVSMTTTEMKIQRTA